MRKIFFVLMLVLITISGCNKDGVTTEVFEGTDLKIAIVGEKPKIQEKSVDFSVLKLEEIKENPKRISKDYDAIFIMSEKFSEADDDIYVETYKELTIPTFFIGTTKLHLPFVNEDVTYENSPKVEGETAYVAGYLYQGTVDEYKDDVWKFYLNKDIKSEANVQSIYTDIFKVIDNLK